MIRMSAKEMLEKVQELKENELFYGKVHKPLPETEAFLVKNFIQILDILDDALYAHTNGGK